MLLRGAISLQYPLFQATYRHTVVAVYSEVSWSDDFVEVAEESISRLKHIVLHRLRACLYSRKILLGATTSATTKPVLYGGKVL